MVVILRFHQRHRLLACDGYVTPVIRKDIEARVLLTTPSVHLLSSLSGANFLAFCHSFTQVAHSRKFLSQMIRLIDSYSRVHELAPEALRLTTQIVPATVTQTDSCNMLALHEHSPHIKLG